MVETFIEDAELVRRKAIFSVLNAAHSDDDDNEDNNQIALFLKTAKAVEADKMPPNHSQPSNHFNPNQSFGLDLHTSDIDLTSFSAESPNPSAILVSPSKVLVYSSVKEIKAKQGRKRKRPRDTAVPEALQIFKGLIFYFFPNDDVAPARKARIRKATEMGAAWEKDWSPKVTHIIADKGLSYEDVLKYLKIASLPTDVIVVNEGYTSSCLTFGQLVDPNMVQHRVKGQPHVKVGKADLEDGKKPPMKSVKMGEARTPLRPGDDEGSEANEDLEPMSKFRTSIMTASTPTIAPFKALPTYSLEDAIQDVQAVQDLPLDSDDEDVSNPSLYNSSPEPSPSCDPSSSSRQTPTTHSDSSDPNSPWQKAFHCMQPSTMEIANPNARTIEILQQMATHYDRIHDHWRTTAYRKAISALRRHPNRICTKAEALALNTIGDRLADKIEEIVQTDNLRFLQSAAEDPQTKALKTFLGIYQVGSIQASAWIAQGYRTLEDLVMNRVELAPDQQVGLEHYEDFNQRIPRTEMDKHANFVQRMIAKVEDALEVTIGGSYRRGARESGDIDFIIASPQHMSIGTLRAVFFDSIVPRLYAANYLKCVLAATNARSDSSKWHGACALPSPSIDSPWRRIDFLLVPYAELGAAMIYFTGNDIFNRSMRLLARKKGMRLNQRGLWKGVEGGASRKGGEGGKGGVLVASRDERAIFDALGVQWVEAYERNV